MRIHAEARGLEAPSLLASVEPAPVAGRLRWSRFLAATGAEGPGVRAALWVQGCGIRCPDCFNPQMWAAKGATLSDPGVMAAHWVREARDAGSAGLTLLGGEPFDQAEASAAVAEAFHAAGMDVMTFTGYGLEQLQRWSASRPDIARLLAATDLLCDGPYLREMPDPVRPWIGSKNQSIRALSPVHAAEVRSIAARGGRDRIEIRIGADGSVAVNGWAPDTALSALLDDLGSRADLPSGPRSPSRPRLPEHVA